jgi:hypothetical protein
VPAAKFAAIRRSRSASPQPRDRRDQELKERIIAATRDINRHPVIHSWSYKIAKGELVHTKGDGTQVTVASRWSLRQDERGRPAGILETNNDITERKRAEYLTSHVFESSPDSMCIIDCCDAHSESESGQVRPSVHLPPDSGNAAALQRSSCCGPIADWYLMKHMGLFRMWTLFQTITFVLLGDISLDRLCCTHVGIAGVNGSYFKPSETTTIERTRAFGIKF